MVTVLAGLKDSLHPTNSQAESGGIEAAMVNHLMVHRTQNAIRGSAMGLGCRKWRPAR
jgi:hypothetical protein